MNTHIEILTAAATAALTTGTVATAVGSDSLMLKKGDQIDIIAAWQTNQTAGFGQLIFPTAHDTTRGYRANAPAGVNPALLKMGIQMRCQSQETLAPIIAATAVAGDVENMTMLLRYKNSPGMNAHLITPQELDKRAEKWLTIENSLASTAGPSYGTPETFIADSDLLQAQREYAIVGLTPRTQVHAIYVQTPDGGNVRFGCPGMLRQEVTSQWFELLSRMHGEALIPVFNSSGKGNCFVGVITDENAGTFVVDIHLALLK
jgi:hypothetical protein